MDAQPKPDPPRLYVVLIFPEKPSLEQIVRGRKLIQKNAAKGK